MSAQIDATAHFQAEAPTGDVAGMGVRELIGELARLEDATRGWSAATWAGRSGANDPGTQRVLYRQRQIIAELRRRRRRR